MNRLVASTIVLCSACCDFGATYALPPLGMTPIDPSFKGNAALTLIDGNAYVSSSFRGQSGAVWSVKPDKHVTLHEFLHPDQSDTRARMTRVAKGPNGDLYVAASFRADTPLPFTPIGSALFRLDQPTAPVVTWSTNPITGEWADVIGVDETLRGVGDTVSGDDFDSHTPAEFLVDGTIVELDRPLVPVVDIPIYAFVRDVSESGYAFGGAQAAGSLRVDAAMWTPEGEFSFVYDRAPGPDAPASSVRDRADGNGINIGIAGEPAILYSDRAVVRLMNPVGDFDSIESITIVSQSDFAVVNDVDDVFAYYTGIVPGRPGVVRPIKEVFPELATVNFTRVSDLAATDGHIFMTLSGPDGLYLFGARDPSVIPEPSTVVLAFALAVVVALYTWRVRRRGPKRGRSQYCSARYLLRAKHETRLRKQPLAWDRIRTAEQANAAEERRKVPPIV